eukprot:CAMPEP_0178407530 /NCGR_PEP_ID=MMETSP0689_2-20121128/19476_1 /TAXON_ID=160604 /ORGANISM="Amphidinium massartii, Strain CS-259" /LENGTH=655 /DNA_ID=CAMNT_0020028607 /DNA_START=49 /DNA_END=2013 /DNA_ORIENTATION=-
MPRAPFVAGTVARSDFGQGEGEEQRLQSWVAAAPQVLGAGLSFRASMRGGLVAVPVMATGGQPGGFRIKLLRLSPNALHRKQYQPSSDKKDELDDATDLLAAQLEVGLRTQDAGSAAGQVFRPNVPETISIPQTLLPDGSQAQELLQRYVRCCSSHADGALKDCFDLVAAVHLGKSSSPDGSASSSTGRASDATSSRVSAWLAKVNIKTVQALLRQKVSAPHSLVLQQAAAGKDGEDLDSRLRRVFHYLTANSVRGALRELSKCTDVATRSKLPFDRLSMLLAACAGASSQDPERRQWMKLQVARWRAEGVQDLMGPELWRIFCLLGGDLQPVLGESLDWRTAFGMHLWYDANQQEDADMTGEAKRTPRVARALTEFDATVGRQSSSCHFRPVPAYVLKKQREAAASGSSLKNGESEPVDLEFSILRVAVGLLDQQDLAHFDYTGHTSRPMDMALSWHLCLILLALAGAKAPPAFDLLSQQYSLQLELRGHWEWATYVASFIADARARALLIRGMLQRNVEQPHDGDVAPLPPIQRIPEGLMWRAQALRCEAVEDWVGAVSCWRKGTSTWRALTLVLSFLQAPMVLYHARAPLQASQSDMVVLSPMTAPAQWLLSILEEAEGTAAAGSQALADLARMALSFMRRWAKAEGPAQCK